MIDTLFRVFVVVMFSIGVVFTMMRFIIPLICIALEYKKFRKWLEEEDKEQEK